MSARMSIAELQNYLRLFKLNKISVLLRGKHGIGKSQILRDFAKANNLCFRDIRLGQVELGDLIGLPYRDENTGETRYAQTWWWPDPKLVKDGKCKGFVIMFDEFNRGREDVQQAAFQIVLDRGLYGKYFSEDFPVFVFAAVNDNSDVYQVSDMDPALIDRFFVVDLEPTVKEFLDWSKPIFHPALHHFLSMKENHELIDCSPEKLTKPGEVQPSRRSWERVNDVMRRGEEFPETVDPASAKKIFAGFVGIKAAETFAAFLKNQDVVAKNESDSAKADPALFIDGTDNVATVVKAWNDNQVMHFIDNVRMFFRGGSFSGDKNITPARVKRIWQLHSELISAGKSEFATKLRRQLNNHKAAWDAYLTTSPESYRILAE